jgi:aspartate/methionine/tyrosine aminotransferase
MEQEASELIAAAILPQEARKMMAISNPTNPAGK